MSDIAHHRKHQVAHLWTGIGGSGMTFELHVSSDRALSERVCEYIKDESLWPVLHLLAMALNSLGRERS